jgi:hypothetical protein
MSHAKSGPTLARSLSPSSTRTPQRTPLGASPQSRDRDVARPVITLDRLRPADLDLAHQARTVWRDVLVDVDVRGTFGQTSAYHRITKLVKDSVLSCPLVALAELLVWLGNRRIPESRVRLVLAWLEGVVATIYAGRAHPDLDQLDIDETEAESIENRLCTLRLVHQRAGVPITREHYEAEALANYREGAISITRGRELDRRARLSATSVLMTSGELA